MMGAPNLISDNMDCGLSYSVISYLKKLSQQVSVIQLLCFLTVKPTFFFYNGIQTHIIPLNILYHISMYYIHLVIHFVCMRSE